MRSMPSFRPGDRVRVDGSAPGHLRPGSNGRITDVRRLEDEGVGCRRGGGGDALVLVLQLDDGTRIELPGHLAEAVSNSC